jgi:FKBP-type peptidyl-prolyl cis-trans isomerase
LATTGDATEVAPGVYIWDLMDGTGAAVGANARTVTVSVSSWTEDGTQYFGDSAAADELIFPANSTAAFAGWGEAIDGMRIGGTRKIWAAAPDGATSWPVNGNAPITMDITLNAINANADMTSTLPGADVAGAAPQGGADGLRFYDLAPGNGTAASAGDAVAIRYEAWLADGTPFGSATGDPVTITLDNSIAPGIANGLQGLAKGAKRKLIVPAAIGIGFDPLGSIPAGSTIVMDVEIVDITAARPAATTADAG